MRILKGMDRVNRNFLWGTSKSTRKVHWVGWQKVTKPKKGGLSLQAAKGRNTALLAKLNWRFHIEKDSLWACVLKSKYCSSQRLASRNQNKLPCSQTWSAMKKGREVFNRGVKWTVGRSSNLSFWYDYWANHGVLRSLVTGPLSREDSNMKIRDIFKDNMWDWRCLYFDLPQNVKLMIQATILALATIGEDKLVWSESPQRNFDLKSMYKMAMGDDSRLSFSVNWIW